MWYANYLDFTSHIVEIFLLWVGLAQQGYASTGIDSISSVLLISFGNYFSYVDVIFMFH